MIILNLSYVNCHLQIVGLETFPTHNIVLKLIDFNGENPSKLSTLSYYLLYLREMTARLINLIGIILII